MYQEVNYYPVAFNGGFTLCNQSSTITAGNVQTVLNVWNGNAQKTIASAACNNPSSSTLVDVPNHSVQCGADPPNGYVLSCANWPTQQSPQPRTVWVEPDVNGVAPTSFLGSYYNNINLSGAPTLTRTDNSVNFDWGTGSPDPSIQPDNFSAAWTASVLFEAPGNYVFSTTTDDGVRLYVDNTLYINHWVDQPPTTWTATVSLTAGQHSIRMEYYEHAGGATAKLTMGNPVLQASVISQEVGHNLGFAHTNCANGESVMANPICADYPAIPTTVDQTNWTNGYYPDGALPGSFPTTPSNGCIYYNWIGTNVHNEWHFDTWNNDNGWNFVRSDPQDAGAIPTTCGQMPGTRTYYTFSVSNAYQNFFGGSVSWTINVPGVLPSISSLVAYGTQTMQVNWTNSTPAGDEVHIEMATSGPNGPWAEVGTDTASPFVEGGLSPGTTYYFRTRSHSHSGGGFSSYSSVVSARTTPDIPPGNIGASFDSGGPTGVTLCWSSSFGATYYIIVSVQAGNGNTVTTQVNPNSSCYGANLGTITMYFSDAYHFAVKACNESGCSGYKDPVTPYQYWTRLPCTDGSGVSCNAGGSPNPNSHGH
jgi:hypothetical protein